MNKFLIPIKEAYKREKVTFISNISVITITFVLLGVMLGILTFSQTAIKYLENQAQITVFFKDDFTEDRIMTYQQTLLDDPRILSTDYVSKEDALRIFKELNNDDPLLLESISASILPASLEIKANKISDLKALSQEIASVDGVEEVRFFEDVVDRFKTWSTVVYIVGTVLLVLFTLVSYSVISNTLKSTIDAKGPELEVLRLVGATDDYVRNPLVQLGVFFSLFSSFLASVIIMLVGIGFHFGGWFSAGVTLGFLSGFFVSPLLFFLFLCVVIMISGFLLGLFSSKKAIKKYLKY